MLGKFSNVIPTINRSISGNFAVGIGTLFN